MAVDGQDSACTFSYIDNKSLNLPCLFDCLLIYWISKIIKIIALFDINRKKSLIVIS